MKESVSFVLLSLFVHHNVSHMDCASQAESCLANKVLDKFTKHNGHLQNVLPAFCWPGLVGEHTLEVSCVCVCSIGNGFALDGSMVDWSQFNRFELDFNSI